MKVNGAETSVSSKESINGAEGSTPSIGSGVGTSVPSNSIEKNGTKVPAPGYKQTKVGVIPEDWDVVQIKDVTDYVDYRGKTPKKVESGILLVTARNIKQGYLDYDTSKEYIAKDDYSNVMSRGMPKIGDVLLTTEAPLGNIAQIDNENIALAQRVIKFRAKNDLDNTYLKYHFLSERFQQYLYSLAIGTTVLGIQGKQLHKMLIPIPSLKEQKKIAQILTTWDDTISKQENLIKSKETLKKRLMQKLLSGDWDTVKFEKIIDLTQSGLSRKLSSSDIGVPVIRSNNILNNRIDTKNLKYWYEVDDKGANLNNYFLEENDILVNFINSLAQIGKMAIYRNELKRNTIFTTNILRVKFNYNIEIEFIKYIFQTKRYSNFILSISKPAVNQASFTTKDFRKFTLRLPPKQEQQKIAKVLTFADKEIELLKEELETLKEQKRGLMQRLLSGVVRVRV